jgi:hypothetical protein
MGVLLAVGSTGQSHMPYFRGPAYFNTDLALSRTIRITENQKAQIKFSATNFLNHPLTSFDQSNDQNLKLSASNGVIATSGSANGGTWNYGVPNEKFGRRILEMSLRYNFYPLGAAALGGPLFLNLNFAPFLPAICRMASRYLVSQRESGDGFYLPMAIGMSSC